jgi:flavin reductase (DIM6/NTAB) family NADH-FMN oxidoreductase RutF
MSDTTHLPIVTEYTVAYVEAEVTGTTDMGEYLFFVARVIDADVLGSQAPMTYAYYHAVKGGKSSKQAPTYVQGACDIVAKGETGAAS